MEKRNIVRNQKGFTLIEIIAVLVILGVLAAVAVPKYMDLTTQAAEKSADGVYGGAQSTCSMNFAQNLMATSSGGTTNPLIKDGATLLGAMDATPDGWTATTSSISDSTNTYTITVTTAETTSGQALLSKSW